MNRSEIANRYNKRYTKTICVRLNVKTDRDILERLNQVGNKCGYIKQLIREDTKGGDEK